MKIPLLALIFQGIPEQIAVVTLAFVLAKVPLRRNRIVLTGICLAFTVYVVRLFPISFGVHTFILTGLLFIYLSQVENVGIVTSLKACLITMLILIITETVCFTILMSMFQITSEIMTTDTTVRIITGWPQVLILFLLAFILHKIRTGRENHESFRNQ